jgi:polysaccharide biosynthesis protein PslH
MRDRLLVLSQCLPFPPHSGVANRTFNILLQLQREFDLHVVAFSRRNHQPNPGARESSRTGLEKWVNKVYEPVPVSGEWSQAARISTHLRSLLTFRPYTYYEYGSSEFGAILQKALTAADPALVHVDSLDLYRWLSGLGTVPYAVTHHSVESDLLRSRARRVPSAALREYLNHQARLVAAIERRLCPDIPLNVMMSETDAAKLRALAPGSRTLIVPNGVDVEHFVPQPEALQSNRVVFLGPTYMYPNRDALDWFVTTIWADVRAAVPAAMLHLVGKTSEQDRRRYESAPGVCSEGYVPDVRPHLAAATCSVVPIRIGGGTRLKILDAWAMGTAVVSTSTGCEGLATEDGANILVRDDPADFAAAVIEVLRNPELRAHLAAGGRATAEQQYSWRAIGDHVLSAYRQLTAR